MNMHEFSLTKHDPDLLEIIKPVKQYSKEHRVLAEWAIECLNRYLPAFKQKYPDEIIPDTAIATLQKWIRDEKKMWDTRKYTYTVLGLAKELEKTDKVYAKIVRATAHCIATCHVPTHSEGTAMYIVSFIQQFNKDSDRVFDLMSQERQWQYDRLVRMMAEHRD
jgi:hypothetical protein